MQMIALISTSEPFASASAAKRTLMTQRGYGINSSRASTAATPGWTVTLLPEDPRAPEPLHRYFLR